MTSLTMPNEIINYIFLYCQGSANKIMKQHIQNICELNKKENVNEDVYSILQLNLDFGYLFFHYNEFIRDYV